MSSITPVTVLVVCSVELDAESETYLSLFLQNAVDLGSEDGCSQVTNVITCTNQPGDLLEGHELLTENAKGVGQAVVFMLDNRPGVFKLTTISVEDYTALIRVCLEVAEAKENKEVH